MWLVALETLKLRVWEIMGSRLWPESSRWGFSSWLITIKVFLVTYSTLCHSKEDCNVGHFPVNQPFWNKFGLYNVSPCYRFSMNILPFNVPAIHVKFAGSNIIKSEYVCFFLFNWMQYKRVSEHNNTTRKYVDISNFRKNHFMPLKKKIFKMLFCIYSPSPFTIDIHSSILLIRRVRNAKENRNLTLSNLSKFRVWQ